MNVETAGSVGHETGERRKPRRLSQLFINLSSQAQGAVSIGTIRDALGNRSFAALLVLFALINLIPLPPGTSAVLGLPLLIPFNVVGTIWQIFARGDIGLFGVTINALGFPYNYTAHALDAWLTVLLMDVWHWTPLVVLLCYAGLRAIPEAYYQAARIDGASAWATFRFIQLPRLRGVLTIAVLLRFMDSFMIYTEPFVLTGGGPGNATTFLSQYLTRLAVGQFDLGPAAAFSLVYFLVILLFSYVFYTAMTSSKSGSREAR